MTKSILFFCFFIGTCTLKAQEIKNTDTLQNIIVHAFQNNRQLLDVAAPVSIISQRQLQQYNNVSIVESMNMIPGINMDERSPGSYRLNFRGSSVRSPFGVRNVKVYYNGIPFTDPGGNTYLQILGFYNYNSIEIIKGPSGSMYGSGTGGVMMINDVKENNKKMFTYTHGSYKIQSILADVNFSDSVRSFSVKFNRQSSDGYRDHTAMHRDVLSMNVILRTNEKQKLTGTFLYGNLYYQTPGALTLKEYQGNPRSARPKIGSFPSADQAQAAFHLNYFLTGLTLEQQISPKLKNELTVYGAYAQNRNPNFRNYSRTSEPHFGARTNFHFSKQIQSAELNINVGGEYQHSFYSQRVYGNNNGATGPLQTDDEVFNTQSFGYVQAQLNFNKGYSLTAGSSINFFNVDFNRFSGNGLHYKRDFKSQWAPRLSILKKFQNNVTVYASVSKGFSPPSISELLPSTDIFNQILQAERGINFEIGSRASLIHRRLFIDVSFFKMDITNVIVQKRDSSGADYFTNAGSANQQGIEALISFHALQKANALFKDVLLNFSATIYDFKFENYKPINADYSGNKLPGTSPLKLTGSIDLLFEKDFNVNITSLYNGSIALNDANTEFAKEYFLLGSKISKQFFIQKAVLNLFAGIQNIFDETYSLGNDINAAGGRYYNVAPGRTFYGGVSFAF